MRQTQSVRYAILGLVSRSPKGVHGYALKRQCDRILGQFWQLNFGEIYRVLDRLTTEDLIEQIATGDPKRKVYRITDRGRESLDVAGDNREGAPAAVLDHGLGETLDLLPAHLVC